MSASTELATAVMTWAEEARPQSRKDLFKFNPGCISETLRDAMGSPPELAKIVKAPAFGIRTVPLFTPEFCDQLVWFGNLLGCYERDPGFDPYTAYEFDASLVVPLQAVMQTVFDRYLKKIVRVCYDDFAVDVLEQCFVLRYSADTQASMGRHFDHQSEVSACVTLNEAFEGGGLLFPRYEFSTKGNVPKGHVVLFPGRVTHVHEAAPVTSGVRYSQTWWMAGAKA
jgi:hypothetical protein